jgi:hypothetical protein
MDMFSEFSILTSPSVLFRLFTRRAQFLFNRQNEITIANSLELFSAKGALQYASRKKNGHIVTFHESQDDLEIGASVKRRTLDFIEETEEFIGPDKNTMNAGIYSQ